MSITCFFYKHIKVQGLGSDMLKATQNIDWKYAFDMLILSVKIFKMKSYSMELSHNNYFFIIFHFYSQQKKVFLSHIYRLLHRLFAPVKNDKMS